MLSDLAEGLPAPLSSCGTACIAQAPSFYASHSIMLRVKPCATRDVVTTREVPEFLATSYCLRQNSQCCLRGGTEYTEISVESVIDQFSITPVSLPRAMALTEASGGRASPAYLPPCAPLCSGSLNTNEGLGASGVRQALHTRAIPADHRSILLYCCSCGALTA